jgi:glycolate oxidase
MTELIELLRAAVGPANVISDERLEPYSHDATFMEGPLAVAVLPASTEEVARVVRICADTGTPLVARGAGTSLTGGSVPMGGALVLSLERLDGVEIDPDNVVAVAGAGVITGRLQEEAAVHGLMYPPDPASVSLSSIGGNVSCNAGGMCCVKYGVTSDYVIGLTVVLADGTVLRLGGRTRKRASGYRLAQLFVGSEGTLGIVTEVILKLIPLPRHHATAMLGYHSLEAAAKAVARLLGSGHFPAAIEIMDRTSLELVQEHLPPGFEPRYEAVLIVDQDGNDLEQVQMQLLEIAEILDGADNRVAQSSLERDGIWNARRGFGKVLMAMRKNFFAEDVAVPIARIPEMVRRVGELSRRTGVTICIVGHAGDGNLHPHRALQRRGAAPGGPDRRPDLPGCHRPGRVDLGRARPGRAQARLCRG